MNLEELIDQQIELGNKNPHDFYDNIIHALGEDLIEITRPYIADFITEMARQRLNRRRLASVAKITSKTIQNPQTMLHSLWVPEPDGPNISYKRISDMTAQDFDARAHYLERMAHGINRHARWCRDQANEIRANQCRTAGELGYLLPLTDHEDL